jgi:pyruvate formate lyase activating enzyme
MKEASFYGKVPGAGKKVKCVLCPRNCVIADGQTGFCMARKNVNGKLYAMFYRKPCSVAVDPVEKKPLFHFAPGSQCVSIATFGCNLGCLHCQNWEISRDFKIRARKESYEVPDENLMSLAGNYNASGFAYTYTEPTVFFEYALDVMKLAKKRGFYNVWVTNGYTPPEVIAKMAKYLDAVNVDIKGNDNFYKKVSMAPLGIEPVFRALKAYKKHGVWTEVTNLVIPMYNDKKEDMKEISSWVKDNLGADTPLHFSAFFPNYKLMDIGPTPQKTLDSAVKTAKELGLHWVYAGNIYGHKMESTWCWKCGGLIIKRVGFSVLSFSDICPKCGTKVPIEGRKWMNRAKGGG